MNSEVLNIIFGLLGGLSIFIYGMNIMGEGLQKTAGERMRRLIEVLTSNPFMGILVGTIVTILLQSSTGTTVLVIGLVSAKLMTLTQAIGVIMGANIGTTITAQLIAFKIGHYAYLIVAIGFILFFFFNKKIIKYIGQSILGFGLLFIGLNIMSSILNPLARSPFFSTLITGIGTVPILGVLVGTAMTLVVQSSSATIAVLQNLASQPGPSGDGIINLETAIPILLGGNVGTTITAIFASIGARTEAKRAALAHSIFNILGVCVFFAFIPVFTRLVVFISPKGSQLEVIVRQIANAHSLFNILGTLLFLPFVWILARVVTFLIKGDDDLSEKTTFYLDTRALQNPAIAMDLATKELIKMAEMAQEMMKYAKESFVNSDINKVKKVDELEDKVDILEQEITKYLATMISKNTLTERQAIRLAGLMHVTNDIERIGDHCLNIADYERNRKNGSPSFSMQAISEMSIAFEMVNNMVYDTIYSLQNRDTELAKKVLSQEHEIDELEAKLRASHFQRLNSGLCNPMCTINFVEFIRNLERIADHCNNIAEVVLEDCNIEFQSIEAV